jgi:TatD DNase family protein
MGLIDSHAHLTYPEFHDRIDAVLARCAEVGVERVITIGTTLVDAGDAVELVRRYPARIHAAAGIHPHHVEGVTPADLDAMAELWDQPEIVAFGEMGLDYHYDFADRRVQRTVLAGQLARAATRAKPVVIHCRAAFMDAVPLLVDQGFSHRPVVFHCFTGTAADAARLAEFGWRISFTGIVTFPKSTELQAIAKDYPADQLLIETDSPYLSPVPVRKQRPNEPANVAFVAKFLAELRGCTYDELVEQTASNTRRFFRF